MIYMVENPWVREAFFPSYSRDVSTEPARQEDGHAIMAIAEKHESPEAARLIRHWWANSPRFFYVMRDGSHDVAGFSLWFRSDQMDPALVDNDPLARNWWKHLKDSPVAEDQTVCYVRRWLSLERGESPSPVQAASWLDVKRAYMELRPYVRRCYISVCDLDTYGPIAQELGFRLVEDAGADLDGIMHHLAVLDFGPGSIDGWLTAIVASELGLKEGGIVDVVARELVLGGERVALTKLEFELMHYLYENEGKAVSRADLLEKIWGYDYEGGSNVVDVVVRSLRTKLGERASLIETVRGVGYRYRGG
jgi:hypothetical protein